MNPLSPPYITLPTPFLTSIPSMPYIAHSLSLLHPSLPLIPFPPLDTPTPPHPHSPICYLGMRGLGLSTNVPADSEAQESLNFKVEFVENLLNSSHTLYIHFRVKQIYFSYQGCLFFGIKDGFRRFEKIKKDIKRLNQRAKMSTLEFLKLINACFYN